MDPNPVFPGTFFLTKKLAAAARPADNGWPGTGGSGGSGSGGGAANLGQIKTQYRKAGDDVSSAGGHVQEAIRLLQDAAKRLAAVEDGSDDTSRGELEGRQKLMREAIAVLENDVRPRIHQAGMDVKGQGRKL